MPSPLTRIAIATASGTSNPAAQASSTQHPEDRIRFGGSIAGDDKIDIEEAKRILR
jgi:hypothetical protein